MLLGQDGMNDFLTLTFERVCVKVERRKGKEQERPRANTNILNNSRNCPGKAKPREGKKRASDLQSAFPFYVTEVSSFPYLPLPHYPPASACLRTLGSCSLSHSCLQSSVERCLPCLSSWKAFAFHCSTHDTRHCTLMRSWTK